MRWSRQHLPRFGAAVVTTALLGALLCSTSGVRAEPREGAKHYQLRWVREGGAESCVSGAALERFLSEMLQVPSDAARAPMLLEGVAKVAAEPLHFAMRVTVRDQKTNEVLGERELTTADPKCSALTPSLLLVLAMSVDPDAGRSGLPPAVTEELRRGREEDVDVWPAAPDVAPRVVMSAAPHPEPQAASRADGRNVSPLGREQHSTAGDPDPRNEPRVFGGLLLSVGVFPALASGAELGARVPLRRGWSLAFSVLGWFPQTVALPPSPYLQDDGVQVAAGQLNAALCRPLFGARVEVGICGGIAAGLRWVSALALGSRDNPTRPFYGPTLALDGTFRVTPSWFVTGGVTAQATVPRDRFTYRDHLGQSQIWFEPSLFSGRAGLGVGAFL